MRTALLSLSLLAVISVAGCISAGSKLVDVDVARIEPPARHIEWDEDLDLNCAFVVRAIDSLEQDDRQFVMLAVEGDLAESCRTALGADWTKVGYGSDAWRFHLVYDGRFYRVFFVESHEGEL